MRSTRHGPVRAGWLAIVLCGATALAAAQAERRSEPMPSIAFLHFHQGEQVGVTTLTGKEGGRIEERLGLDRDLPYHRLGLYSEAEYAFDVEGRLAGYRLAAVAQGEYLRRRAEVTRPPNERAVVDRRIPHVKGYETRNRIPLLENRPLIVFDLNMLGPLVRFCNRNGWKENFDAFHQVSPVQVIQEGVSLRLEAESAFWLKRTARERLAIEGRVIGCVVYALHIGERDILLSVDKSHGDLMKIEEPALGYEIRRTFTGPSPPRPRGVAVERAFGRLRSLVMEHALGIDLRDRGELAFVTYGLDIPYAAQVLPGRPWQVADATVKEGRLRGTLRVNADSTGEPEEETGPPETGKTGAVGKVGETDRIPAAIRARGEAIRREAKDSAEIVARVARFVSEEIGFVYNVEDPAQALEFGFGNVKAKARLAEGLLEAAGLRTRPASGLVFTGKAFVLHRWIEIWFADRKAWVPIDPTLGEIGRLSPLHLTLGTPWSPSLSKDARFSITVEHFRFKPGPAGERGRVRWPDGEKRVYGFYKSMRDGKKELWGYLASVPTRERNGEIRFKTDLILDFPRIQTKGYLKGEATSIFDSNGSPSWFSFQTWSGGKRYTLTARVLGGEATIRETGRKMTRFEVDRDTILAANSFYHHWTVFFTTFDPASLKRATLKVLVPNARAGARAYTYNLVRREKETVTVPALGREVQAYVYDLAERNLRFWVTETRLLVKVAELETGVEVLLEKESIRERF